MKRRELIKQFTQMVANLSDTAESMIWYTNPITKESQPVPRHNEINENLAESIIRKLSNK